MSLQPSYYSNEPPAKDDVLEPRLDLTRSNTSAAQLSLQRYFEQNIPGAPPKDGMKPDDPATVVPPKGKPRLLLMGQRR
jgi:Ras-related GTP-binding protein C/D